MKINQLILLCSILNAATAYRQEFNYTKVKLSGTCPTINYINNLIVPRLMGFWYRLYSTFVSQFCYNNEGQTMYASQYDETTLGVAFCCRSAADKDISYCGTTVGSGTCIPTDNSGEFIYNFDNQSHTIYILGTDYDNYAIIYGCDSDGSENIFLLSRDRNYTLNIENDVINILQMNGADFSKAKPSKQGPRTPYPPNVRNCG